MLVSDCPGPVSPGSGIYSAPELDMTFNLREVYPTDSLEIMGEGAFQANYTYYLWPADCDLPVIPLVPIQ